MGHVEGLDTLLKEHPAFAGLSDQYGELVAGCAANEVVQANDYVFREGDRADKFYLVRHGSVSLEVHAPGKKPIIVDTVDAGELLGWSWLVPPYRTHFDARARELTRLTSLDATCLRGKMEEDHELGYELHERFAPVLSRRLTAALLRLIDVYAHPRGVRSV